MKLLLSFLISSFDFLINIPDTSNHGILELIQKDYLHNFSELLAASQELVFIAEDYASGKASLVDLQEAHLHTRLAFKSVEYLLEFLDPYFVSKQVNGAPLLKLEPKVPELNVLQPKGLQILDELIFSENPDFDINQVIKLSKALKQELNRAYNYQSHKKLQYRYIIEAARYEVIRIYTLGLTGFDTPGSINAIPEAIRASESILSSLQQLESIAKDHSQKHLQKIVQLLNESILYLKDNPSFDTLDRLEFLTRFTNPLYKELYQFHATSGIEFSDEIDPTQSPHNYHSQNLFDDDFLMTSFYSEVAQSDLDDELKIELGEKLFNDTKLSKDLSMSCQSGHQKSKAFTDVLPKSKSGKEDQFTLRNSPSLHNSVFSTRYFWDMREYNLERQVKHVIEDSLEFNINFIDLADRLRQDKSYYNQFKTIYGSRDRYVVSTWSISNALAAYVASLTGFNSEFDQYVKGDTSKISAEVRNGYNLFMGKAACGTCHFAPVFNGIVPPLYQDSESEVLGVLMTYDTLNPILDTDPGRGKNGLAHEEAEHLIHSFKTVSVRNAELTAPYMHNGSIPDLESLLDFYNKGGGAGIGLNVPHQTLSDQPLGLESKEISDIIAFMTSLTSSDQ